MEQEKRELFIRIPLQNIRFEDSYEQSKLEKLLTTDPDKIINYIEDILKGKVVTISL